MFLLYFLLPALFFAAGAGCVYYLYGRKKQKESNSSGNPAKPSQRISAESFSSDPEPHRQAIPDPVQQESASEEDHEEPSDIRAQKTIDDLYIVNDLGQNVTSSLNLQETFRHLSTTIDSMMDASYLELSVFNHLTNRWKVYSSIGNSEHGDLSDYNNLSLWSYRNDREVFLSDAENDFERYVFKPLVLADGRMAKSAMVFPVHARENISGTLCIVSFRNNSFNEYHRKIIRLLLGYIAVAIQNAVTHEELNITKQRAERSEKFMQQFLANMSHEIRTPINAVTGMTRLLLEKNPAKEQLKYLESIRNASDSLLVIINDILDLSKIEAGKIELEKIDLSITDIVKSVVEIMHFKAEEKGLILTSSVDPDIPPVLTGDPTRLTQILINLAGNAIKFTEKGEVKILVSSLGISQQKDSDGQVVSLQFDVSDTGIGMTKEQQEKLFQEYTQASTETARKYGGTGLGLSISRQLVLLQGGEIKVRSRAGEGTVFTFSLPYLVSKNKSVSHTDQHISQDMLHEMKGIRILLADDNEYNRIVVKETLHLKIEDSVIDEAVDGEMALEMIKKNPYDLVLMDLVMPKKDGLEATEMIRNTFEKPLRNIPIVALTASVVKSEIEKSARAGMNGFIPKPFKSYELIGAIYSAFRNKKNNFVTHDSDGNPGNTSGQSLGSGGIIDVKSLKEFSEGDNVRLERYVNLFLKQIPENMEGLKTFLQSKDIDMIRVTVHNMKPQLRIAGVKHALELAERIEQACVAKSNLDQLPVDIDKLIIMCQDAVSELSLYKKSSLNS